MMTNTERDFHNDMAKELERLRGQNKKLREALDQIMPRYCELFEHAGLGNPDESVAVEIARSALVETE